MLLSVNKLTKCGGGSLTSVNLSDRSVYYWKLDENFIIQLESTTRPLTLAPYATKINGMDILSDEYGNLPVLCFNKLIDKWFCKESKAINYLESDDCELKELSKQHKVFNENEGFYSNPIDALANWNIETAIELLTSANKLAYQDE